jgi:hypothetical protein
MWDDEDNNPYGSFARHDSNASDVPGLTSPGACTTPHPTHQRHVMASNACTVPYRPATPPSAGSSSPPQESPEYISQRDMSDVDYNDVSHSTENVAPKKGGYDSRVEQWLYENPESSILITFAGKNLEGGGGYIAYTINTGVRMRPHLQVRAYS